MPRADDPRVVVRMSATGYVSVKAAADKAGVAVSGLMRECAERYAVQVAQAVERGEIIIRRNSVPEAVTGPAAVVSPSLARAADEGWSRQQRLNERAARSRK